MVYSLILTCRACNVEPYAYLVHVLTELPQRGIRKPETFDFLGFTHCCSTRRSNGDFKIVRLTIKKRMRATLVSIRETLMRRLHEPVPVIGQWLRRVLRDI